MAGIPWEEILKWVALFLALLIFLWLYRSLVQEWQETKKQAYDKQTGGSGESSRDGSDADLEERRWRQGQREIEERIKEYEKRQEIAKQKERQERLRKILERDPDLVDYLPGQAGNQSVSDEALVRDPEWLDQASRLLDDEDLDFLDAASREAPVEVDIESGTSLEETVIGGEFTNIGHVENLDQLPRMRPGEYIFPKKIRHRRLLSGEATRRRYYRFVRTKKLLYFLRDRSGSMCQGMANGLSRDAWARGVMLKYARLAIKGKSRFYSRDFDGQPHQLVRVTDSQEARAYVKYLVDHPAPTSGGTYILGAIQQAVTDISSARKQDGISQADIVLVSDGEDRSVNDTKYLKKLLGNIRLHVVMIGLENQSLQEVAATYRVIR